MMINGLNVTYKYVRFVLLVSISFIFATQSVDAQDGFLSFPLKGSSPGVDEGLTPYTAVITSVFDHSQSRPYEKNTIVTAYTGERGEFMPGVCFSPVGSKAGYKNQDGEAFEINGHYYTERTCPVKGSNWKVCDNSCDTFLFYDGHPGVDYRASGGVNCGKDAPPGLKTKITGACWIN
jgi:hypothetical protein